MGGELMPHSKLYLGIRDTVRVVFWLGVGYGVMWLANLIVPGLFT